MAIDAVTGALALVRELKRFWEAYKNKDGTSGHARALVHSQYHSNGMELQTDKEQ